MVEIPEDVQQALMESHPLQEVDPEKVIAVKASPSVTEAVDRLTCQLMIAHEHFGANPFPITGTFADLLETREQVFHRRTKVTKEWKNIPIGWFDEAQSGLLIIENQLKKALFGLSPEEQVKAKSRVVFLQYEGSSFPQWLIRAGRFHIGEPINLEMLQVRTDSEEPVEISVYVIPR